MVCILHTLQWSPFQIFVKFNNSEVNNIHAFEVIQLFHLSILACESMVFYKCSAFFILQCNTVECLYFDLCSNNSRHPESLSINEVRHPQGSKDVYTDTKCSDVS